LLPKKNRLGESTPADGIAAAMIDDDFGTSSWPLGGRLHQLREQVEGAMATFSAMHESVPGRLSNVMAAHR